jgi:gluconokinase
MFLDAGNVYIMVFESPRAVIMGVAGCGKSSLASAWALAAGWAFVEGDALHSAAARARMAASQPLTEAIRRPWLGRIAVALQAAPGPALASASLLRRAHRDQLRAALPGLRIAHLCLSPELALARCAARPGHFFPASLVASQFATLEPTVGEADVLELDASEPLPKLLDRLRDAWC